MEDEDRFAGLGAEAISEAERESVVKLALEVMATEVVDGPVMSAESAASRYVRLKTGGREREVFGCRYLTTRKRLVRDEELFYGSIDRTTVYSRVILQQALRHNAAALICYQNHPSGTADRSPSDVSLTSRMKDILDEVDVRLLDHIVVSRDRQTGRKRTDLTERRRERGVPTFAPAASPPQEAAQCNRPRREVPCLQKR